MKRRLAGFSGFILCVAVGTVVFTGPQSAAAAPGTCHDVYFVSARGSGQPFTTASDLGSSPEIAAVEQAMVDTLHASGSVPDVEIHQLSYPAPSVDLLTSGLDNGSLNDRIKRLLKHNLPSYLDQERQGERELARYLDRILANCAGSGKNPQVVLAGYSQGSMVVHNTLQTLSAGNETAEANLIAGAVLIADPERVAPSQVLNFGTAASAPGSYGICPALDVLPGGKSCLKNGPTQEITQQFLAHTVSVCDTGDLVCDTGSLLVINTKAGYTEAASLGSFIHSNCHSYCGATVRTAGAFIGRRLLTLGVGLTPLLATTRDLPTATVGMAYTATLNATGGAQPYAWTVTGGNVPFGLMVATDGTISGTPVAAGSYGITATVTDGFGHTAIVGVTIIVDPAPSTLTINNSSGAAGLVSWVTGITCPTPAPGDTMWVIPQGAGQPEPDLSRTFPFAAYHGAAFVASDNDAAIGSATATITCSENASPSSPAGAVTMKTYSFIQTITEVSRRLVIQPAGDGNPARFTISDGGGCGPNPHGIYGVNIQVYDNDEVSNAFLFTGLAADGAGHWPSITLTFPTGPALAWAVAVQCTLTTNQDSSGYDYPVAIVPVP